MYVNECHPGDSATLNVRTHIRYAADLDVAESRTLPVVRTMDEFIRVQQDSSLHGWQVPAAGSMVAGDEGSETEERIPALD